MKRFARLACLAFGIVPIAIYSTQQPAAPTSEQVFKDIRVFKGVPASDLIPAMEFMSASMGYQCKDCHDPKDYAAETPVKKTAREMVELQRDINTKFFKGRLEVTCMSCHNGKEHPASTPLPTGVTLRHERMDDAPKPADLFSQAIAAVGKTPGSLIRTGTLTSPDLETHKIKTEPMEFIQAADGKFRMVAGDKKVGFDGTQVWYGPNPMTDEPAAIFGRIGRAWRGEKAFEGLNQPTVSGKDKIGKTEVIVVTAARPASTSTEQLYFDAKTHLLVRLVNIKRSTIGAVVSSIDYSNYKDVNGTKVPMKVVVTFPGNDQWVMDFKLAKVESSASDALFKVGG